MRIGFYSGEVTEGTSASSIYLPYAQALQRLGHDVFILYHHWTPKQGELVGIPVHYEPLLPIARQHPKVIRQLITHRKKDTIPHPYYDLAGLAIARSAKRLRLDMVYSFHNVFSYACLPHLDLNNTALAINLIGFGIDRARGGTSNTFPYQSLLFAHPDWSIHATVTEFELKQYRQVYEQLGISQEPLILLPHSYNESLIKHLPQSQTALRQKHQLPEDHWIMVYPVSVYPRKNIEMTIDIVAELNKHHPTNLVITGRVLDEDYFGKMKHYTEQAGLTDRIHFWQGRLSNKEMAEAFNVADLTLFPSHQETFGIGIVESLACGTPVVGPAYIPPCLEILSSAVGTRAAEKTVESFVSHVLDLMQNGSPSAEEIIPYAYQNYSSTALAQRFLGKAEAVVAQKQSYRQHLESIDWKGLYQNEVNII